MSSEVDQNRRGWDVIADRYQTERGWPSDDLCWGHCVPRESELRLLGDLHGKRALVLGCGGGQDVIALVRQGAASVVGVDPSPRQLDHARTLLAEANVAAELLCASATALPTLADATFDVAVSVHALTYVGDIDACLAETRRLLVPGGIFGFSLQHPIDTATRDEPPYGFHKSYFEAVTDEPWTSLGGEAAPFRRYHRTIADWFEHLQNACFSVERLLEPRPVGGALWDSHAYGEKLAIVPGTLVFVVRKPR